jgi:phosphoglycolate phosphatase-like HAD superfamily hydrolase
VRVLQLPLLVFDFDGVLVDGMEEYWWSARRAALALEREARRNAPPLALPEDIPTAFRQLRPQIHKGWEMVLMAAELGRPDGSLETLLGAYPRALADAQARWGQSSEALQALLEAVRREALRTDQQGWLERHHFYPGVRERLQQLEQEGARWVVLTTKGEAFTAELLQAAGLRPVALYGHEAGSKTEVLRRLLQQQPVSDGPLRPLWFVEDRRPTLELVRQSTELATVRCLLASWGYLAPGDRDGLEELEIQWLTPERFQAPLAEW